MKAALGFTDTCPHASSPGLIALVPCDLQIQLTSLGTASLQCLDAFITRTTYSFQFYTLSRTITIYRLCNLCSKFSIVYKMFVHLIFLTVKKINKKLQRLEH